MNDNYRARPPQPGPTCEYFAPLLPLLGQERLNPGDSSRLRQHLATCAYCQSELASYDWLDNALARHFGPAPRGPLSPADIRELTSRAYRPRIPLQEPMLEVEASGNHHAPRPTVMLPPERPQSAWRRRRLLSILGTAAAILVIVAASLALFKSHSPSKTGSPTPTTSVQPSGILPSFSDWRIAYIGANGVLHAISQDGLIDSSTSNLPMLTQHPGFHIASAGVSPDGHFFAYGNDQIYIINLATQNASRLAIQTIPMIPYGLYWSPDSKWLAVYDNQKWSLVDVNKPQEPLLSTRIPSDKGILGWIDTTHVLAVTGHNAANGSFSLDSVDVFTGAQKTIATVLNGNLGAMGMVISPDGKRVLLYTQPPGEGATSNAFSPFIEVIDTSTGQKHTLPQIAQKTGADFASVAWKPDSDTIAVTGGLPINSKITSWVLDVTADTATKLPSQDFPVGWAPDTGALILSTSSDFQVTNTPHKISIMHSMSPSPTQALPTVLVQAAYSLPFVGFVRTASLSTPTPTPTPTTSTGDCSTTNGPILPPPGAGTPVPTIPLTTWATYTDNANGFRINYPNGWQSTDSTCGVGHLDLFFTNYHMEQVLSPGLPPGAIKIELSLVPGSESGSQSALDFWNQIQQADQQAVGGPACPSFTTRQLQVAGRDSVEGGCPALNWDLYIIPDHKYMLEITESAASGIVPSDVLTQMVNSLIFTN